MTGYPVLLDLKGRHCVVVGGGKVAARKVRDLLGAGASVTVVSQAFNAELLSLMKEGKLVLIEQVYQPGLVQTLFTDTLPLLLFAATNNPAINQQIVSEAQQLGILVNRADDADEGDFHNMAVARRGSLTIAVSSGGTSPVLAAYLRDQAQLLLTDALVILAGWMESSREALQQTEPDQAQRRIIWHRLMDSRVLDLLHEGDLQSARSLYDKIMSGETP
ncbi:MAG: bifunctional precorrin-2 dehydrogenase/sirohydrochlorin ferrochelatase [bacterium]|nr:bifunctional precorrin-2 dehydrogenase/sirohydrochlorin ferrochelatase [bacterium]